MCQKRGQTSLRGSRNAPRSMPVTGLRSHVPGALIAADMRDRNPFAQFALAERCVDELCQRSASSYPLLPIAPPFDEGLLNPCIHEDGGRVRCIPAVHVTGGWHSFVEEGLGPLLSAHPHVKLGDKGTCFNGWEDDPDGPTKWFGGWEVQPMADLLLVQSCTPLLSFYPSFPSGYLNAFLNAYWPCKAAEVAALKAAGRGEGEYYDGAMWSRCRPRALAAHDLAVGTGGLGHELTPPFVMRSVYGNRTAPRVVALLRSPIDRLETSFWAHPHYPKKYGSSADGLHAYAAEQTGAFAACETKHSARRCAFLFEMLEKQCAAASPPLTHPPTPPCAHPPIRWPRACAAAAAVLLPCLLSHPPAPTRLAQVRRRLLPRGPGYPRRVRALCRRVAARLPRLAACAARRGPVRRASADARGALRLPWAAAARACRVGWRRAAQLRADARRVAGGGDCGGAGTADGTAHARSARRLLPTAQRAPSHAPAGPEV